MTLHRPTPCTLALAAAALAIAGCASNGPRTPSNVPASLQVPGNRTPYIEALATGVQIYACDVKPDQANAWAWQFRAPEASLTDPSGRPLGRHYAGPTWESPDGSAVVGRVQSSDPGPDAQSIPWLLLNGTSAKGAGVFSEARFVQRLFTKGGVTPSTACGPSNAKQMARVPYSATYYFYRG